MLVAGGGVSSILEHSAFWTWMDLKQLDKLNMMVAGMFLEQLGKLCEVSGTNRSKQLRLQLANEAILFDDRVLHLGKANRASAWRAMSHLNFASPS